MNKLLSIAWAILINVYGYSLLVAPSIVLLYDNTYALYYSYFAYSILSVYAILYFSGAIKCDKVIASAISIELRSNNTVFSYLPVILVFILSVLVIINSNYHLGTLMLFPLILNFVSRSLLFYKARL